MIHTDATDEFQHLLACARAYDGRGGEPERELEEKRQRLLALARQSGVQIEFVKGGDGE